jgi:hypothetical protein
MYFFSKSANAAIEWLSIETGLRGWLNKLENSWMAFIGIITEQGGIFQPILKSVDDFVNKVNSAFAKIPIPTTPISQWFDNDMGPYKYWNPPAERISKLKFKFRYHNGQLCEFGQFQFSFMLEFNILKPQQERSYSIRTAFDLGQVQGYGSKFF